MTEYQFAPKVVHKYPHYHQGIVYRLYKEAKNWQSAENRCKEDGGHLASIHNQEQEEFIHSRKYLFIYTLSVLTRMVSYSERTFSSLT